MESSQILGGDYKTLKKLYCSTSKDLLGSPSNFAGKQHIFYQEKNSKTRLNCMQIIENYKKNSQAYADGSKRKVYNGSFAVVFLN